MVGVGMRREGKGGWGGGGGGGECGGEGEDECEGNGRGGSESRTHLAANTLPAPLQGPAQCGYTTVHIQYQGIHVTAQMAYSNMYLALTLCISFTLSIASW